MKLVVTITTKKTDGPMPTFDALRETIEEELTGMQFEAQNEGSSQISLFEMTVEKVERG